jgi:competence protein ComEC
MKKIFVLITIFLFCGLLFCENLKVYFIDVGQGDATFIVTPQKKTILIDAGDKDEFHDYGKDVVKFIKRLGYYSLDLIFLTHAHRDHCGGMEYVLENLEVKKFYDTGFVYPSETYKNVLDAIKRRNVKYELGRKKEKIKLDPTIELSIVYPDEELIFDDPNNNSMVIRIKYGEIAVLVTGDIESPAEQEIVRMYKKTPQKIYANILKVPHHGSNTSSTLEFLNLVSPEVAIISCGINNRFGHPKKNVLNRYKRLGINIFRTDLDGTVEVVIDGKDYQIKTSNQN